MTTAEKENEAVASRSDQRSNDRTFLETDEDPIRPRRGGAKVSPKFPQHSGVQRCLVSLARGMVFVGCFRQPNCCAGFVDIPRIRYSIGKPLKIS